MAAAFFDPLGLVISRKQFRGLVFLRLPVVGPDDPDHSGVPPPASHLPGQAGLRSVRPHWGLHHHPPYTDRWGRAGEPQQDKISCFVKVVSSFAVCYRNRLWRNEIATRKRLETRIRRKNTKEEIIFNLNTSSGMSGKAYPLKTRVLFLNQKPCQVFAVTKKFYRDLKM